MTESEKETMMSIVSLAYQEGRSMVMLILVAVITVMSWVALDGLPTDALVQLDWLLAVCRWLSVLLAASSLAAAIYFHIRRVTLLNGLTPEQRKKAFNVIGPAGHPLAFVVRTVGLIVGRK